MNFKEQGATSYTGGKSRLGCLFFSTSTPFPSRGLGLERSRGKSALLAVRSKIRK